MADHGWSPVAHEPRAGRFVALPPASPSLDDPLRATGPTLGWGIVATGAIAASVAPQIALLEDARIVAVSSRSVDRARAFAASLGGARAYGDREDVRGYEQLAEDPDVDVVYVAAPNGAHVEVAVAMLQAGKHVVVEKTMAPTAEDARYLIAQAQAAGRFLMEGTWTRFLPLYRTVMDAVASGAIGTPVWFQGDLGFVAPEDPTSRLWAKEDGGGVLLDLIVYPWTWAYGVFGRPDHVVAYGASAPNGVDALLHVTLGYPSHAVASMLGTLVSQASRTAVIAGTEGTIHLDPVLPNPRSFTLARASTHHVEEAPQDDAPFTHQFREATRCIQAGLLECPTMPPSDTALMMEAFDAIEAGRRTRRSMT